MLADCRRRGGRTGQLYREETFVIGLDRAEGEEVQAGLTGKSEST
jgi:hypothetical protein